MSVTTILGNGVPKPALVHWAAGMVATCALESLPKLVRVRGAEQRRQTWTWLKNAAERKRDTAGNLGGLVHDAVEAKILGQPFAEPTDEQAPYMQAFANFLDDHQPVFESTELTVASPADEWCGRLDFLATLPRIGPAIILGDWKTGKGVYAETAMQLAAYVRGEVAWTKTGEEVQLPEIDSAYVVHLRPDKYPGKGYAIYPAKTGDNVYACFLAARDVALRWVKDLADSALGDALDFDAAEVA
jgi:hypothetical protein